jgi:hypothetical protein
MGYVILENTDALKLTAEVSRRMAEGWRPQGGVACYHNPLNEVVTYLQAMVRETN